MIVRLSQGEAEDEVGGVEIEHAVVEDGVNAPGEVFVTDGGLAKQGIDFPTRGAGQQADADGVGGSFLRRCGWAEAVDGQRRRRRKYMRMSRFLFMLQSYKLENSE